MNAIQIILKIFYILLTVIFRGTPCKIPRIAFLII